MGKRARGGDANALRAAVGKGSSNASTIAHRKFACGEALFERYYRAQRVTASEGDDFQALMGALATPLPATFRAHAREEMGGDVSRALAAIGEGSVREVFPGRGRRRIRRARPSEAEASSRERFWRCLRRRPRVGEGRDRDREHVARVGAESTVGGEGFGRVRGAGTEDYAVVGARAIR